MYNILLYSFPLCYLLSHFTDCVINNGVCKVIGTDEHCFLSNALSFEQLNCFLTFHATLCQPLLPTVAKLIKAKCILIWATHNESATSSGIKKRVPRPPTSSARLLYLSPLAAQVPTFCRTAAGQASTNPDHIMICMNFLRAVS